MKILVTGATGFIGGNLARELWRRGDDVQALIRPGSNQLAIRDTGIIPIEGDILGGAGAMKAHKNFGHGKPGVWYSDAIADKLSGIDQNPDHPDILAEFNSNIDFYFGMDGNTPANRFDFVTLVLHGLIHGIGFVGQDSYDVSTGEGSIRSEGVPSIYDLFVVNGSGREIISFNDPSVALGRLMTGGELFWNGVSGKVRNAGSLPKLYVPTLWEEAASYSH